MGRTCAAPQTLPPTPAEQCSTLPTAPSCELSAPQSVRGRHPGRALRGRQGLKGCAATSRSGAGAPAQLQQQTIQPQPEDAPASGPSPNSSPASPTDVTAHPQGRDPPCSSRPRCQPSRDDATGARSGQPPPATTPPPAAPPPARTARPDAGRRRLTGLRGRVLRPLPRLRPRMRRQVERPPVDRQQHPSLRVRALEVEVGPHALVRGHVDVGRYDAQSPLRTPRRWLRRLGCPMTRSTPEMGSGWTMPSPKDLCCDLSSPRSEARSEHSSSLHTWGDLCSTHRRGRTRPGTCVRSSAPWRSLDDSPVTGSSLQVPSCESTYEAGLNGSPGRWNPPWRP